MPLEAPLDSAVERVADLNRRYAHHAAHDVLTHALTDPQVGNAAMVSSFGAESVVLLHMLATIDRTLPVLFVDTEMLFPDARRIFINEESCLVSNLGFKTGGGDRRAKYPEWPGRLNLGNLLVGLLQPFKTGEDLMGMFIGCAGDRAGGCSGYQ